jgi:hypothetical protein
VCPTPDMRTPAQPLGDRAGGASREEMMADGHSLKTEDRTVRREQAPKVGRKHLRPTIIAWTRPSEAPTGSRPCRIAGTLTP